MPTVIDARGLEPPQPFELAMESLADLAPGQSLSVLLDRVPFPLFRVLDRDGYPYRYAVRDDGAVQVDIDAPARGAASDGIHGTHGDIP